MQSEQSEILREAESRIKHLERAVGQINKVKTQLKQNAFEVKNQISSTFSRQLEGLRSREVYLLQQVEVLQHAKEEVLRCQQDTLCHALGGLRSSLELTQDSGEQGEINKKFSESLERLNSLDLNPDVTPNLNFRADMPGLRDQIRAFGRVDSHGLLLENAFATPETPSTCLPHMFEDYEDAEHHILYKTLDEVRRHHGQDTNIAVHIPRLQSPPWLSDVTPSTPANTPSPTVPSTPPLYQPVCEKTTKNSLQSWLHQMKGHVEEEVEEESFDVVSPFSSRKASGSSDMEVPLSGVEYAGQQQSAMDFPYFSEIQSAPSSKWLSPQEVPMDKQPASSESAMTASSPIRYQRMWLAKRKDMTDCCSGHCAEMPVPSVEIENLADLGSCVVTPGEHWARTSRKHRWLTPTKAEKGESEKEIDEMEPSTPCVMDGVEPRTQCIAGVCRANEPCESFNDCLCDDNCSFYLKSKQAKNADEPFDFMQMYSTGSWLMSAFKHQMDVLPTASNPFSNHVESLQKSNQFEWLQTDESFRPVSNDDVFQHCGNDNEMRKWLSVCTEQLAVALEREQWILGSSVGSFTGDIEETKKKKVPTATLR